TLSATNARIRELPTPDYWRHLTAVDQSAPTSSIEYRISSGWVGSYFSDMWYIKIAGSLVVLRQPCSTPGRIFRTLSSNSEKLRKRDWNVPSAFRSARPTFKAPLITNHSSYCLWWACQAVVTPGYA